MFPVAPPVAPLFWALLVVPDHVDLLGDTVGGLIIAPPPHEVDIIPPVGLDMAEHNGACQYLAVTAWAAWVHKAVVARVHQWFEGAAAAHELDGGIG